MLNYYKKFRNNQSIYYRYRNNYISNNNYINKIKEINNSIGECIKDNPFSGLFTLDKNTLLMMKFLEDINNNPKKSIVKVILKLLTDLKQQYKYYLEKKDGCSIIFKYDKNKKPIIISCEDALNIYIRLYGGYNNKIFLNANKYELQLLVYFEYAKEAYNNYYYNKSYVNNLYSTYLYNLISN
jgi:hypothetical protein